MHALAARLRSRIDLVCVLLLAALLRVVLFAVAAGSPERFTTKDSGEYIGVASHLRDSYLGDSGPWFDLGLRRTPGYPLFLRGVFETFGTHDAAVVAVQLVVSVATVWLVNALASHPVLVWRSHALRDRRRSGRLLWRPQDRP